MRRGSKLALAAALAIVVVHLAMRWAGLGEHASVLAGMPRSSASLILGPAYVLSYFAAVIAAPITVLNAVFALAYERLERLARAQATRPRT